jgi:hypothetical protein
MKERVNPSIKMISLWCFPVKKHIMTSIMTTPNISSLSPFSALSQANDYEYYDQSELEPSYEYCDASGNPYLDTIIPAKLSYVLLDENDMYEDEPILDLSDDNRTMLTDLSNSSDRCPMRFMNTGVSWGSAVGAYTNELAELKKVEDLAEFTEFNEKNEADVIREAHVLKLASLPKFPKAMLERMKKEAEEASKVKPNASAKFYTWKKGVTSSSTSHTAWGHRRNGGGKGKVQTLSEMNSEKAISELAAKKRLRQQANKEQAEVDAYRRAEKMKTLEIQKIAYQPVVVETPVVEVVVVEETDFQKFRREEMAAFNTKSAPVIDYVVDTVPVKTEKTESKWNKVDAKQTKSEKLASTIANTLFTQPPKRSRTGAINKLADMKKGGGEMRSRLCKSVMPGSSKKCPHGIRCKFAHSPEQLSVKGCLFGDRCNFVRKGVDSWENTKSKICQFGHPGEETDKASFCKRIGMVICQEVTTPIVKVQQPVVVKTMPFARSNFSYSSAVNPNPPSPRISRFSEVVPNTPSPRISKFSTVVEPPKIARKPPSRISRFSEVVEPIVIDIEKPRVSTVRSNFSYSSAVVEKPRVFKIHIDQLGRTTAYIISMKLTNVVIEFI